MDVTVEARPAGRSEPIWDERELQHVRDAVCAATMRGEPSDHLYVENIFSERAYAGIERLFPSDPQAFRRWDNPGDPSIRFGNYLRRQEVRIPEEAGRLTAEQSEFWTAMIALLGGPQFARILFERFPAYVRSRFGSLLDDPSFIGRRVRGTMILNQHDADYYLGPHTDRGEKIFTCLFYFPEREGLDHLGTTLYRPLERGFSCPGLAHHDPARFERAETMPYRRNSSLIFARTDVMFHGVHALTEAELQGSRRRGIQMQLYVLNERPREQCRVTLQATLPERLRAGEDIRVDYRLTNRATTELASSFPYTTQLGYRWFDEAGMPVEADRGVGTELPGALAAGETKAGTLRVIAPQTPGRHTLRLSVVQEGVAWFDDIDPNNAASGTVVVADDGVGGTAFALEPDGGDIAAASDGVALGEGWHAAERFGPDVFRWVENDAVVHAAVLTPRRTALALVVEPGPGVGSASFVLSAGIDGGLELGSAVVTSRQRVAFVLPPQSPAVHRIVLHAAGGGRPTPNDTRVLNFRVFAVRLDDATEPPAR
jgi:hypothetical protein